MLHNGFCSAGIHFLSGGQSEEQASANLNAMNAIAGAKKCAVCRKHSSAARLVTHASGPIDVHLGQLLLRGLHPAASTCFNFLQL